jgi:acyl-CoA thioester hydrolase
MAKLIRPLLIHGYDIDVMGHVSNLVYIRWMEDMRHRLLEAAGLPFVEMHRLGFGPVLMETHITYRNPIVISDTVTAELWLSELKGASAIIEHRFCIGDGVVAAEGRQKGVFVSLATMRPLRLKPDDRDRFLPFLGDEGVA